VNNIERVLQAAASVGSTARNLVLETYERPKMKSSYD
jgi:hypothetical protein